MPLAEVVAVRPVLLGIVIEGGDRRTIRTFVSCQTWDERWTPRATRVAEESLGLARSARGETP